MAKDKRLPLAMTTAALLLTREASALGLGGISLHSALNQPLDAEIALQKVGSLTSDELFAHLADAATFERLGLDRPSFLQNLRFTPVIHDGHGFIHVVSSQPVREPFLNFLLEVGRPGGALLREYTVLLDPPDYGATRVTRDISPLTDAENPAASEGVSAVRRLPDSTLVLPSVEATPGEGRYTVVRNDTLWRIAGRLDRKHSNRMHLMAQLYQLNPQAFVGNDPSRLSVGRVLVLPEEPGQASAAAGPVPQVASPAAANTVPTGEASPPAESSTSQPLPEASAPVGPATQLDQSQEQLMQLTAERDQLNQRIEQLQQHLTDLQQQIDNRDSQILDLQRQLNARRATVPTEPATVVAPAPVASVDDSDGLSWYSRLTGALVLLAGALLLYRRRHRREGTVVSTPTSSVPAGHAEVPPMSVMPAVALAQDGASPRLKSSPTASATQPDPVDIYIAYGFHADAREILTSSIQQEPQRSELRLKLMMVLAELGDTEGFIEQEAILRDMDGDLSRIEQLRDRYPTMCKALPLDVPAAHSAPVASSPVEPLGHWQGLQLKDHLAEVSALPQATAPMSVTAEPLADKFDLDDLSLDLSWPSLDDPFQVPDGMPAKTADAGTEAPPTGSHGNLYEFPRITESDLGVEHGRTFDPNVKAGHAHHQLLTGLDQAQASMDRGDLEQAFRILMGMFVHGESREQEQARALLAQIA